MKKIISLFCLILTISTLLCACANNKETVILYEEDLNKFEEKNTLLQTEEIEKTKEFSVSNFSEEQQEKLDTNATINNLTYNDLEQMIKYGTGIVIISNLNDSDDNVKDAIVQTINAFDGGGFPINIYTPSQENLKKEQKLFADKITDLTIPTIVTVKNGEIIETKNVLEISNLSEDEIYDLNKKMAYGILYK